jgi:hypothetical protein
MAGPLVALVAEAVAAGVLIDRGANGVLTLKAPKSAGPLAKQLRARQSEVLQLFDWHRAQLGDPLPCLLCGQPALLRDPVDRRPCHKVCVDQLLNAAQSQGAPVEAVSRLRQGTAA